MNYLSVENLSKYYGDRVLFEGLNFGLEQGDKVALVANNGTGKSTLLSIIAGKDVPDSGRVVVRNGIRVGFLDQDPVFDNSLTVDQQIQVSDSLVRSVINEYEKALNDQSENFNESTQKAFELAASRMELFSAWDHERKMKEILTRFNIVNSAQTIGQLSGGQKKRLALALLLIDSPELLILDEPTNHLDVEMIEWLEDYLYASRSTLLMVTHDRYFLDRVCNSILEMTDGKLYHHEGNYTYFLEKRAEREEAFNVELGKTRQLMKKELEWMRKMPKARTTKSKSRISAFYDIKEKASVKKIKQELKLEVKMSRIGGKVLELKKVYKSFNDKKILAGFDYTFKKGERIGIIGKNGVGKSTFLNIITGKEMPDSGKVNVGDTIVYGYYTQEGIKLSQDKRVIEVVKDIADVITMGDGSKLTASQFLQHFMFAPDVQYTYVSKLSGGERRRLYLLTVLIKNPNFLVLDEPTNDLDLLTLNKLEEFLMNYQGCVIIVSHDRYFMDKLVDHLFVFEGDAVIRDFPGTYTEYRIEQEEIGASNKEQEKVTVSDDSLARLGEKDKPVKKGLSYKEKIEFEKLAEEIEKLETEKKEKEDMLASGLTDYNVIRECSEKIKELMEMIDGKTARWLELSEML